MSSLAAPHLDSPAWLSHHHLSLPAGPETLATLRAVRGAWGDGALPRAQAVFWALHIHGQF